MCALQPEVAIVTGASSGIGAAIAVAFGTRGYAVTIGHDADAENARDVADRVRAAGGRALVVEGDVGSETVVARMFAKTKDVLGIPTILVNNAGINGKGVLVADMTLEQWERTLRVNLTGPFLCSRAFVRERRGQLAQGRIVNVSSVHESVVFKGYADYDVSKSGMTALTRTLALEVAPLGVRVNAVAPGMILTPMNAELNDAAKLAERAEHVPIHRAGTPEEVAELVVYLCSDLAAYIVGSTIYIDGGLSLNVGQGA